MTTPGENGRSAFATALAAAEAPTKEISAREIPPMLAESADAPFNGPDWIFELKIDGYRALLEKDGTAARIIYRSNRDVSRLYLDLVERLHGLPIGHALLDGEIAVLDATGRPSFGGLQKRAALDNQHELADAARNSPVVYFAFDLLAAEGKDLRGLPLLERKKLLQLLLAGEPAGESEGGAQIKFVEHVEGDFGRELFARACAVGLEGVVGKKADSTYRSGRSATWRKLRMERTADFAIAGFMHGSGSREALGSLHLCAWDGDRFVYAGGVGSGIRPTEIDALKKKLMAHPLDSPPCIEAPKSRSSRWCQPLLVCEVRYYEVSTDGLLRQPVFLRLRDDKKPEECAPVAERAKPEQAKLAIQDQDTQVETSASESTDRALLGQVSAEELRETPGRVRISNPQKLLWRDDQLSKTDLIEYYRAIAPYILPWVRDRPATLTRYPDGIEGKSFFQKHAADYTPEWIRLANTADNDQIEAICCDNVDTLLYVANLANIPLHVPHARLSDPERPDTFTIDLDPKSAPFADVIRVALELKSQCDKLGLPCFIKTSGQSGLHVIVPLGSLCTHEEAKGLAELLSRLVEAKLPKLCTLQRMIDKRSGRVYLDTGQNGRSKTVAAAYSVRPIPGARASTPLHWDEVNDSLDPAAFTLRTLPARARKLGADLLLPALTIQPDIPRALAKLTEKV